MERKIQKKFIDYGCGFPVLLCNVPMIKVQGQWIPDINYNDLEKTILQVLCHKPCKLTGSEIRFIRLYFGMTLQAFAKRFGVQHPTVLKWESFKDEPTNMALGTEKDIRLFVTSQLIGERAIGILYQELVHNPFEPHKEDPIQLDIDKLAI